jgi:Adenosine deaminase
LLAKGLAEDIPAARKFWDDAEAKRRERGSCETAEAAQGCKVVLRYIYEVFRNSPKRLVFAQALFDFELAAVDPRVVGINFVGEEDTHDAMTDYVEHMRMVGFLRTLYPKVRVSLHAGELAPGLVPPEGLCCHVRLAVESARTDRIGHGVDVMYEDQPYQLLKNMADKGVLVEINLTSNDIILGIAGKHHPFQIYRKFGVPVALSTDMPASSGSISRMNVRARWRATISVMRTSRRSCATASSTAFCRGKVCGTTRGAMRASSPLAPTMSGAPRRLPAARRFLPRARRPRSNGSWSAAFRPSRRASDRQEASAG